jgi:ABC-type multidrug transport system fused ATPase/permease subunit
MNYTRPFIIKRFVRNNKGKVALVLVSAIVSSLTSALLPLSIGAYYQIAFNDDSGKGKLLEKFGLVLSNLSAFFLFFATLILVKGISSWIENSGIRQLEERFSHYVRYQLFHSQLNHTYTAFQSRPNGRYLLRYSSDQQAIQLFLSKGIIKPLSDLIFLLLALGILMSLSSILTFVLVAIFIFSALLMKVVSNLLQAPNEKRRSARSTLIGFIEQRFNAFTTIKAFNRIHPEEEKFVKRNNNLLSANIRYHNLNSINKTAPQVIFFIAIGLLLYLSTLPVIKPQIQAGTLLVFILMLLYMQSAYRRMLRVPSIRSSGSASFEHFIRLLNLESEVQHTQLDLKDIKRNPTIHFNELRYGFDTERELFRINAKLEAGHIHRIQGPSGSGKSTLLKLLLKLYPCESGRIFIGEHDINSIGVHDLRKIVTIVSEDYPLIGKSIFESISYSRNESKRADVAKLLVQLQLCSEEGSEAYLDRTLKPQGSDLASGERKMLLLARALLTKKPILLLDDPFGGLTHEMESHMTRMLNEIRPKQLILVVSQHIPASLTIDQTIEL